jgi:hypothetical protein
MSGTPCAYQESVSRHSNKKSHTCDHKTILKLNRMFLVEYG